MVYRRVVHGSQSTEGSKLPDWLDGERPQRSDEEHSLPHGSEIFCDEVPTNSSQLGGNHRVKRIRQPRGVSQSTKESSTGQTGRIGTGTRSDLENKVGLGVINTTVTLGELRDSITDKILQSLIDRRFDPSKTINIVRSSGDISPLAEDMLTPPIEIKRVKPRRTVQEAASVFFQPFLNEYHKGTRQADVNVVLAYYYTTYKNLFKEDDPEWDHNTPNRVAILVTKMAQTCTNNDYKPLINFVQQIMPLWYERLVQHKDFPNTRPTIQALFGDKRHFWANRKVYLQQWRQR